MESLRTDGVDHVFPLALEPFSLTRFDYGRLRRPRPRDLGVKLHRGVLRAERRTRCAPMAEALGREGPGEQVCPGYGPCTPILGVAGTAVDANVLAALERGRLSARADAKVHVVTSTVFTPRLEFAFSVFSFLIRVLLPADRCKQAKLSNPYGGKSI